MITVLAKWEPPCLLWGRSRSGGPFWLLFAAAGKELLARQWAKPQEQFKIAVNAINQQLNETRNAKLKRNRKCQTPTPKRNSKKPKQIERNQASPASKIAVVVS